MSIYLFHGLVYSLLKDGHILEQVDTSVETGLLLGFCVLLTFALAAKATLPFCNLDIFLSHTVSEKAL